MTGRLILVRHGQTTSNVARKLDTALPGAELTALGRQQAYDVGKELAQLCGVSEGSMGSIKKFVCSPAIRAGQTAMIMGSAMEEITGLGPHSAGVEQRAGIHEIQAGDLEMKGDQESLRTYGEAAHAWFKGDTEAGFAGGETFAEMMERYLSVLEDLVTENPEGDSIVVSHGGIIRLVAGHASSSDPDLVAKNYVPNCRYVILRPEDRPFGQWVVERWVEHTEWPPRD